MKQQFWIATLMMSVCLVNCSTHSSPPITTSLESITGESSTQVRDDSQVRLVSVSGLIPNPSIGMNYWYSKKKGGYSSVARSGILANIDMDGDYVIRQHIKSDATLTQLAALQADVEAFYDKSAKLVAAKFNASYYKKKESGEQDAEVKKEVAKNVKSKVEETEELETSVSDLRKSIIDKCAQYNGVVIATWENAEGRNKTRNFFSRFNFNSNNTKSVGGYVIMSDIRFSQLMLGTGTIEQLKNEDRRKYMFMDSFILQARNVIYSASMNFESSVISNLEFDVADLQNIEGVLSDDGSVTLKDALSNVGQLSNMGAIGQSTWEAIPFSRFNTIERLVGDASGWKTIYALKTRRRDLGNW